MITTLYRKDWRSHWKLLVGIMGAITLYFAVIIGMYDPADGSALEQLVAMKLPEEFIKAFGFATMDNSLLGFLSSYLYGFLLLALPLVAIIAIANRLVASLVDRGSMAAILSSAVTRRQVALTQAAFLISAVLALCLYITGIGMLLSELSFKGLLDHAAFLKLNAGLCMALLAVSAVCFFFSCLFTEARLSLAFGAGLPILFLIIQMLVNYNDKLGALRWLSLFSLFVPGDINAGQPVLVPMLVLGLVTAALYAAGILVFDRKDLPL